MYGDFLGDQGRKNDDDNDNDEKKEMMVPVVVAVVIKFMVVKLPLCSNRHTLTSPADDDVCFSALGGELLLLVCAHQKN